MGKELVWHGDVQDIKVQINNFRKMIVKAATEQESLSIEVILDALPFNPMNKEFGMNPFMKSA